MLPLSAAWMSAWPCSCWTATTRTPRFAPWPSGSWRRWKTTTSSATCCSSCRSVANSWEARPCHDEPNCCFQSRPVRVSYRNQLSSRNKDRIVCSSKFCHFQVFSLLFQYRPITSSFWSHSFPFGLRALWWPGPIPKQMNKVITRQTINREIT